MGLTIGPRVIHTADTVLVLFLAFLASGTPMILGDIARHIRTRRREEIHLRDVTRKDLGA